MNLSGLSFNALPPIHLPFRFFLTAPLFAFACAALIFAFGESLWLTRWHPAMLSLTHGFTLGILTMVMMGALLQILPVVAGISVPKVDIVASVSHLCLVFGSATLMLSFIFPTPLLLWFSLVALGIAFLLFIGALLWAFVPTFKKGVKQSTTLVALRFAIVFFTVVVLLGLLLQLNRLGYAYLPFDKLYTNIHALVGGFGWVGLLIMAVSFQVIPMFHVAPNFPYFVARILPVLVSLLLVALIFTWWLALELSVFIALLLMLNSVYLLQVIAVINRRKRKIPDISIRYWLLAAISLLVLSALFFIDYFAIIPWSVEQRDIVFSSIFIYCYVLSVIQALLIKILPFLSYTHLQQRCLMNFDAMKFLPHMHQFISKKESTVLWWLHLISGCLLLVTCVFPFLYWCFTLSLLIEFSWLFWLMLQTILLYKNVSQQIE
ncbi:hypothetical protein [Thalassotalea sp. PLHSN55]|uniref:hypothetical protein n=1 Tax=Thalassotalea sp. PLHSN55 TaxID=3435888 RepID=UPI003F85AA84